MKTYMWFKTWFIFLALILGTYSLALADYNLSLEITSDGSTPQTAFERGDSVFVNIVVNNAQLVAGCAVTLNYPTETLTAPLTNEDGIPANSSDITSIFPFNFNHRVEGLTDTYRANSTTETGKIYLAGAAINAATGGGRYTAETDAVLFTVRFTVKNDAPFVNFQLSLTQTELDNPDAGYTEGNNKVHLLVGAVAQGQDGYDNLNSCEMGVGDPCAFPVLLGGTSNPFSTVTNPQPLSVVPAEADYNAWKIANNWTHIGGMHEDYDFDGYSNLQEFLNDTDPTSQDPPGDEGYDPSTDNRLPYFPEPTVTNDWEEYYGNITIADAPANVGDEIAVYAGNLIVGKFVVTDEGEYVPLYVYGESSPGAGDGAAPGAELTFKVWAKGTMTEYGAIPTVLDGSSDPPVYSGEKEQKNVDLETVMAQIIPLKAGWNLISFGVNKCYHTTANPPNVNMLTGIEYVKVSSIDDILSSIDGQYSYVMGFDETGGKSYNLTPFSNLTYMAAGYGYWIKVNDNAEFDENGLIYLELEGARVPGNKTIPLNEGWNLVGYLGQKVQYVSAEPPTVPFPSDCVMEKVNSVSDLFQAIDGQYSYVMGFDETGGKSYNLTPFSNLTYVGTGYGYWIKVNLGENPNLVWE